MNASNTTVTKISVTRSGKWRCSFSDKWRCLFEDLYETSDGHSTGHSEADESDYRHHEDDQQFGVDEEEQAHSLQQRVSPVSGVLLSGVFVEHASPPGVAPWDLVRIRVLSYEAVIPSFRI